MTSGGEETVFEALPPARGRDFARTWWGRAWVRALEDSVLDHGLLLAARKQARAGAVGAVSVRPGRITAVVLGRDRTPYRADVLLQEFGAREWDRLLDAVAERAGHIAALLERDMPPHLVEDASAAGVDLLPGIGDLQAECGCEEWDHCEHTVALCYQTARILDRDPFVLLLMRGRGERDVLGQLEERSSGSPRGAGEEARGVPAAVAFAAGGAVLPLPEPPAAVDAAEVAVPVLSGGAEPAPGLDVTGLEFLVRNTAVRAGRLLADALAPGHADAPVAEPLTAGQDAARMVADGAGTDVVGRLAEGRGEAGLRRAARAWHYGGAAGLAVLEEEWAPDAVALARARDQLTAAEAEDDVPPLRRAANRWTAPGADVQLRLGRDGRWWPFRKEGGTWWPAGPAEHSPAAAWWHGR